MRPAVRSAPAQAARRTPAAAWARPPVGSGDPQLRPAAAPPPSPARQARRAAHTAAASATGRSPAARRYHALGLAHFCLPPSNVWAGLWQVRRSMIRIVRRAPRSAFQRHPYRVRTAFGDPARRAFFLLSA